MKLGAAPRILVVAAICAAALVGLVVNEGSARNAGAEVRLAMAAVDPRALLSGHYVIVDMREPLNPDETCPVHEEGSDWLALTPSPDGVHRLAGSAPSREIAQQVGPIPVKGSFTCSEPIASLDPAVPAQPGAIWLNLGIDRFYVNQAEAMRIENVLREQQLGEPTRAFAIVSIGRDGRARLKGLEVDGERLELSWL